MPFDLFLRHYLFSNSAVEFLIEVKGWSSKCKIKHKKPTCDTYEEVASK
jgi:hypothetical protein